MGEALKGRTMWYTLKYFRRKLIPFGKDVDVRKLMKGNDEYVYIYVGGEEGIIFRRLHDSANVGRGSAQKGVSGAGNGKRIVVGAVTTHGEVGGTLG